MTVGALRCADGGRYLVKYEVSAGSTLVLQSTGIEVIRYVLHGCCRALY